MFRTKITFRVSFKFLYNVSTLICVLDEIYNVQVKLLRFYFICSKVIEGKLSCKLLYYFYSSPVSYCCCFVVNLVDFYLNPG